MSESKDESKSTQDIPVKPYTSPTADPSPYKPIGRTVKIEKAETQGARPGMRIENNNDE